MCYNYYTDLALARSMYRKQSNQLNNSTELRTRNQQTRSRLDRSNSAAKQALLDKEYSNLKHMLPTLSRKTKISKVCFYHLKVLN